MNGSVKRNAPSPTRRTRRRRRSGEAGFTIIETVMAVVVLAVVGTAVGGASVAAFRALAAAHADMLYTSNLGLTENYLRSRTALVRFPFWLKELPELDDPAHLSLPYVNGNKDLALDIAYEDSLLTVTVVPAEGTEAEAPEEAQTHRVLAGFTEAGWELLKNENEEPIGLAFTLVPQAYPEKKIVIQARFGGVPVGELYE